MFARVTNTSREAGPTTVELFLHSPAAAQEPPKQLKAYTKVNLAAGQTKFVRIRLTPSDLAYYDAATGRWAVAPGRYTALVGTSSTELDHAASFDVGPFRHRR